MKKTTRRKEIQGKRIHTKLQSDLRRREARESKFLDSLHFRGAAKELIIAYEFKAGDATKKRQFRRLIRHEIERLFLERIPNAERNEAEQKMLFFLKKTAEIELIIWENRKSLFTVDRALKMYRAAAGIEKAISPGLSEAKKKIAESARKRISSEIYKLTGKKINELVNVDGTLLSIATKSAARIINSQKPKAESLARTGFGMIQRTILEVLP